jgi:hypothetical protein
MVLPSYCLHPAHGAATAFAVLARLRQLGWARRGRAGLPFFLSRAGRLFLWPRRGRGGAEARTSASRLGREMRGLAPRASPGWAGAPGPRGTKSNARGATKISGMLIYDIIMGDRAGLRLDRLTRSLRDSRQARLWPGARRSSYFLWHFSRRDAQTAAQWWQSRAGWARSVARPRGDPGIVT